MKLQWIYRAYSTTWGIEELSFPISFYNNYSFGIAKMSYCSPETFTNANGATDRGCSRSSFYSSLDNTKVGVQSYSTTRLLAIGY